MRHTCKNLADCRLDQALVDQVHDSHAIEIEISQKNKKEDRAAELERGSTV